MTVGDIIKAVRWCIDEESVNAANINDASAWDFDGSKTDTGFENNIIRYKIPAALRWVCLYAPAEQLSGSSSSGSGSGGIDIIVEEDSLNAPYNVITPQKTLVRVVRVRGSGWSRAILGDSLIKEDSDEYLQVMDTNCAAATADRPQAAIMNTKSKKVEVYPGGTGFTLTYITTISASDLQNLNSDSTPVNIPDAVETSFIYYLAYLLCSAYGDARAKSMYDIAILNLGRSEDKQRQ